MESGEIHLNDAEIDVWIERALKFTDSHAWLIKHWSSTFLDEYDCLRNELEMVKDVDLFFKACTNLSLPKVPFSQNITQNATAKGIGTKKLHEIQHLLPVLSALCKNHNLTKLVDIGAGKCQMAAALLRNKPNLHVTCVEGSFAICGGDWNPEDLIQKTFQDIQDRLILKTQYIDEATSFLDIKHPYLMYSLHACGKLSANMLRMFVSDPNAKVLCNIGCCYHFLDGLLTTETPGWDKNYFALANHHDAQDEEVTEGLYQRALLSRLKPDIVKHVRKENYVKYMRANKVLNFLDHELIEFYEQHLHKKPLLGLLWKMRSQMGAVVETIILLDRLRYLRNSNHSNSYIMACWDPEKSRRNLAIIAVKDRLSESNNSY